MRRPHVLLLTTVVIGLVLAACASPAGSGEPGASSGSEPSAAPAASQGGGDGGGGGGIGTGRGSVQFQINGGFNDSGELPFADDYGYFQQAGVSFLVFTDDTGATEPTASSSP